MKKIKSDTILDNLKNKAVLSAPDGYLEALPDRLYIQVHKKKLQRRVGFSYWVMSGKIAASLLLLIGVFWLFTKNHNETEDYVSIMSEIQDEDIITYLNSRPQFHVEFWEEWENKLTWEAEENTLPDLNLAPEEIEDWLEYLDEIG